MLPDLEWAERIGEFWSNPQSRTFAELLIDFAEDRMLPSGARRHVAGGGSIGSLTRPRRGPR
jgi:hypothetical protein